MSSSAAELIGTQPIVNEHADSKAAEPLTKRSVRSAKDRRASIDAPETQRRFTTAHKQAFVSDEAITSHWIWKLFVLLLWPINQFFHRITYPDASSKLDVNKAYLTVNVHTTHNADIHYGIVGKHTATLSPQRFIMRTRLSDEAQRTCSMLTAVNQCISSL